MAMARRGRRLLLALVLAAMPAQVRALHADQDGLHDWLKTQTGRPEHVLMPTQGKRALALVSDQGAVAAIDGRTGAIMGRQILDEDEGRTGTYVEGAAWMPDGSAFAAASDGARFVRAWSASDGALMWEAVTHSAAVHVDGKATEVAQRSGAGGVLATMLTGVAVLVPATQEVVGYASGDGDELWRAALISDATFDALVAAPDGSNAVWAVGVSHKAGAPAVVAIDAGTGQVGTVRFMDTKESRKPFVVSGKSVHALDAAARKVLAIDVASGKESTHELKAQGSKTAAELVPGGAAGPSGWIAVRNTDGTVDVLKPTGGAAEPQGTYAAGAAISGESCASAGACAVAALEASAESATVTVSPTTAKGGNKAVWDAGERFAVTAAGPPHACYLGTFLRKGGDAAYRVLAVSEAGEVALVQGDKVLWHRDEGIAPAAKVVVLDPPPRRGKAAKETTSPSSTDSLLVGLQLQILQTKVRLRLASPEETTQAKTMAAAMSDNGLNAIDVNGLRKNLVVLGTHGRLVGLHSGDGRELWGTHVPSACAAAAKGKGATAALGPPSDLRVLRAAWGNDAGAEVLVLGATADGSGSYVCILDGHTGAALELQSFDGALAHVLQPVGVVDEQHRHPVVLVTRMADGTRRSFAVPSKSSALDTQLRAGVHFYEAARGAVLGFAVAPDFSIHDTWAMNVPGRNILAMAQPQAGEAVHSHVKVLGDRSVLYRHINPNLLFVASGVSPADTRGRWTAAMDDTETGSAVVAADGARLVDRLRPARESTLHVHLLDAVSGRVLYSIAHDEAVGPVHCVVSENFVVYLYYSLRHTATVVSILELYDNSAKLTARTLSEAVFEMVPSALPAWLTRNLRIESDVYNQTMSAHAPPPLRVIGQSYFVSATVRAMGVSQTLMGLTSKHVYMAEQGSGQVFSVDKRFLDPRRPIKVEAVHREENLVPYGEHLPVGSGQFELTHGHHVARVGAVLSFPSRLESTCHVAVLGLDLLYHRMQPSDSFDSLSEDFSHVFLIVTVTALLVGSVVTGRMARNADLKQKWR